jgi:hypothetical protein
MKNTQAQLFDGLAMLVGLISKWNELPDRERSDKMLVLTLWDDGSGRIGIADGYSDEGSHGNTFDVHASLKAGFNDIEDMTNYIIEQSGAE